MTTPRDYGEYVRETNEWRSAIGRAMISFGELELITYQCLVHLPKEKIEATASRQGFTFRVDLIVEMLGGWKSKSVQITTFIQLLKRAREFARMRNDIAHNPVMLNVFANKISNDLAFEHCISTIRGGRVIDLPTVIEFANEVESLAARMWLQVGKIRNDGIETP